MHKLLQSVSNPSQPPWTVACQAPLSMGFSRQEYWSGLPFPSPGDLPNPGIKPRSPALQADDPPTELWRKPKKLGVRLKPGPQRPRKTILGGKEERFHFKHIAPPSGWHSIALGGPTFSPVAKRSQGGHVASPTLQVLRRTTQVLRNRNHWGNLLDPTTGDQTDTEKRTGFTATSAQTAE